MTLMWGSKADFASESDLRNGIGQLPRTNCSSWMCLVLTIFRLMFALESGVSFGSRAIRTEAASP